MSYEKAKLALELARAAVARELEIERAARAAVEKERGIQAASCPECGLEIKVSDIELIEECTAGYAPAYEDPPYYYKRYFVCPRCPTVILDSAKEPFPTGYSKYCKVVHRWDFPDQCGPSKRIRELLERHHAHAKKQDAERTQREKLDAALDLLRAEGFEVKPR